MNDTLYISTTLPYANDVPHVGHAVEFFQADAYARYFRKKLGKENVFFNMGLDEHGLKIYTAAEAHGATPENYVDELAEKWRDFCGKFQITHDCFYRTSSRKHYVNAQNIWKICDKKGDIYRKYYEGLYCIGCEMFLRERDLVNGKCPDHGKEPLPYAEENYFLNLSQYSGKIIDHIHHHPDFLKPMSKKRELLNFLTTLEDISISRHRSNLPWGIEVPGDPDHVMYVWFEALTNYIGVLGFSDDTERFNSWWPGIQLCGPDNLRFQGAIWQGILAAIGLPFTKHLLVHGTILGPDGQKMSKTLGNVIAPLAQYETYGSDACRFYMLGILQTYLDCSYREEDLRNAYNTYLANNYGNLLNRLIHLATQKGISIPDTSFIEHSFKSTIDDMKRDAELAFETFELHDAVTITNDMVSYGNRYFHENEPWKSERTKAQTTLNNIAYLIQVASDLYEPIIPEGAGKAIEAIKKKEKIILFPRL